MNIIFTYFKFKLPTSIIWRDWSLSTVKITERDYGPLTLNVLSAIADWYTKRSFQAKLSVNSLEC